MAVDKLKGHCPEARYRGHPVAPAKIRPGCSPGGRSICGYCCDAVSGNERPPRSRGTAQEWIELFVTAAFCSAASECRCSTGWLVRIPKPNHTANGQTLRYSTECSAARSLNEIRTSSRVSIPAVGLECCDNCCRVFGWRFSPQFIKTKGDWLRWPATYSKFQQFRSIGDCSTGRGIRDFTFFRSWVRFPGPYILIIEPPGQCAIPGNMLAA
jgi:hypothetical protein